MAAVAATGKGGKAATIVQEMKSHFFFQVRSTLVVLLSGQLVNQRSLIKKDEKKDTLSKRIQT